VYLGHTVKLLDLSDDTEQLVRIVGEAQSANPADEVLPVSANSPMGEELMKARVGETVKVKAPRGTMEFKIVEILDGDPSNSIEARQEEEFPEYLAKRVRRSPRPGTFVVPSSTAVVSFGDPRHARVAT